MESKGQWNLVARVIILVLALSALPAQVGADAGDFAGGDGSAEDPYQITDWYELDAVRDHLTDNFILMNDLDSSTGGYDELAGPGANAGAGWDPIGYQGASMKVGLEGQFDGGGYHIADLCINRSESETVGLFYAVRDTGVLRSVRMATSSVEGMSEVGLLVGWLGGAVQDCFAMGSAVGDVSVGGLVGRNYGTMTGSDAFVAVSGEDWIGGLVGRNDGSVDDCCASGAVSDGHLAGGLIGANYGSVDDCYAIGAVSGSSSVGGLVGENLGSVDDCYASGAVSATLNVGGLVGADDGGSVSDSYWNTWTSGQPSSAGGTGRTTLEMVDIDTFSSWDIAAVRCGEMDPGATWNIVDGEDYPCLSRYMEQFELKKGWNMVSLPLCCPGDGPAVDDVFDDEIEAIYCWDPVSKSYTVPTNLGAGCGYWVAVLGDKVVTYMP